MASGTLFIYTETSTHAGTGAGLGAVDLPIQREKTTGYPTIQGSGVKGALRSQYKLKNPNPTEEMKAKLSKEINIVFGPENDPANPPDHAGAAAFSDAQILAFPVRSLKGVFAWVSCVDVLARFQRNANLAGMPSLPPEKPVVVVSGDTSSTQAFPSSANGVVIDGTSSIVLEEYQYQAVIPTFEDKEKKKEKADSSQAYTWADWIAKKALPNSGVYSSYYQNAFRQRFVILPDEDFRDFTLYATQVVTRIAIDRDKKTVNKETGALFTQELLPADTLMYIPVVTQPPRAKDLEGTSFHGNNTDTKVLEWLKNAEQMPTRAQIGGDETVGRGFVALRWG